MRRRILKKPLSPIQNTLYTKKKKVKKPRKPKRIWTEEEDKVLLSLIKKYGATKWSVIASHMND